MWLLIENDNRMTKDDFRFFPMKLCTKVLVFKGASNKKRKYWVMFFLPFSPMPYFQPISVLSHRGLNPNLFYLEMYSDALYLRSCHLVASRCDGNISIMRGG